MKILLKILVAPFALALSLLAALLVFLFDYLCRPADDCLCDPGGAGCRSLFHADAHRRDCISVSCLPSFAVWTASGGGLPSFLGAGRRQIRFVPVSGKLSSLGPYWPEVGAVGMGRPFTVMERRIDFWLPQLCYSAMRAKAKRLPRLSGIVWTMARIYRRKQKAESISPLWMESATVADEFLLAKASYAAMTSQTKENNVLCYQIRQSFYPGEITPKEANRIGYELAMRWTKGRHAFIVTTHTDKQHIHCHIYYNSTTLDCTRKFRNFWGSSFALRRLSDRLCLENGLSIVENPKPRSRASIGTMGSGRKTGKGRFPIRTDCALPLILRWRNAPLIWTNFSI